MVKSSLLAVLGYLGAASAVPATTNSVPDNIAAIMGKDPSTFTSYKTRGTFQRRILLILNFHSAHKEPALEIWLFGGHWNPSPICS